MGSIGRGADRDLGFAASVAAALIVGSTLVTAPAAAQQVTPCSLGSEGDYSGSYAKVSEPGPYRRSPSKSS